MNFLTPEEYRLCDKCHKPMTGIMKVSDPSPPRRICAKCGGEIIPPKKEEDGGD